MRRLRILPLLFLLALPLLAQKKQITLEAVYDPTTRVFFSGAIQSGFDWIDDTTFVWPKKNEKGDFVEWRVFDVATGKQRPLIDRADLPPLTIAPRPVADAGGAAAGTLAPGTTVGQAERRLIDITLEHTNGNKTRAAELLGISLKTLHNKLNRMRDEREATEAAEE